MSMDFSTNLNNVRETFFEDMRSIKFEELEEKYVALFLFWSSIETFIF